MNKTFFNRNLILSRDYLYNNSTQVISSNKNYNNISSFNKTSKPFIRKIYHSRTRKKLIPFCSYSNSNKIKGEVTPLIFKEYHKKFPLLRNNIFKNNFF